MNHECQQHEKFLEFAVFTGKITQAVEDIRKDIDGLATGIRDFQRCISSLKKEVTTMKVKFGYIGIGIGVVGSTLVQVVIKSFFNQ
jgi:hypothetical protein